MKQFTAESKSLPETFTLMLNVQTFRRSYETESCHHLMSSVFVLLTFVSVTENTH